MINNVEERNIEKKVYKVILLTLSVFMTILLSNFIFYRLIATSLKS